MNSIFNWKQISNIIWPKSVGGKVISVVVILGLLGFLFMQFLYNPIFESYTGVSNAKLTYDSSKPLSDTEFENLAKELTEELRLRKASEVVDDENEFTKDVKMNMLMNTRSFLDKNQFDHIKYFRKAGIRQYKGPETCLSCHETMKVEKPDGSIEVVHTMDDLLSSVHFKFQSSETGFTTYGYDGRRVNEGLQKIPVGKIDRACGIPGSFSWTGWASLIETTPGVDKSGHGDQYHSAETHKVVLRSEGCGQCHIGGNYHPATEEMMPIGGAPKVAEDGLDCLICHSQNYDMNYRFVIKDDIGTRWNQDRTMRAAMSVTNPTADNCLNCHQHNMGGDIYQYNVSAQNLGHENKRILHAGAKRGNPFSKQHDVHAAAGLECTDCHVPQGHKIPRGQKGTDLVANDLPEVAVACENCHTDAPHTSNFATRVVLNGHVNRLACETCHITHLEDANVVLRDWTYPEYEKHEGIWAPTDIYRSGEPGKGFTYLWFNGNGTFLANALGDNPNGLGLYDPFFNQLVKITDPEIIEAVREVAEDLKKHYSDINVDEYVEHVTNTLSQMPDELIKRRREMVDKFIKPLMSEGKSKIYPFKLFNARMYEDLSNRGPYGAMILPFDYNVYYETGDTKAAVRKAIQNPIVRRMYEEPFKYYMMDEFMKYFGVGEWKTEYPLQGDKLVNVYPKWMRQFGTLMVNHGITKDALQCQDCHSKNGVMDFYALGYRPERAEELMNLPEVEMINKMKEQKMSQDKKDENEDKDLSDLRKLVD